MKKNIHPVAATFVLALAILSLAACSSMPESHKSGMQTHDMGPPNRSQSMGNAMMPDRAQ